MKIAVTGNTGLVGSNLVRELEKKHEVVGLSRRDGVDLRDAELVDSLFKINKPDVVYHLAAFASEAKGQSSPIDMTQRNLGIFVNTLTAAINSGVKKFIYTSSVAVYGNALIPYFEHGPKLPEDVYGVNKLAAEQILMIMARVYHFDYVILRPHNIYGPGQNMDDPTKNVVALFMRRLMEKKRYIMYGEGKMRRAFSYVDDVVDVLVQVLDKRFNGTIMNVGSDKDITIKELSDLVQKITGINIPPIEAPAREQEIDLFIADHSIQHSLLKYKNTPLEEGLKKTWEWVKKKKLGKLVEYKPEICLL